MANKPKKTRAEAKAETSARLIKAARKNFFQHGYVNTSMDVLSAEAGVTRGAAYHNFGGKEGLFEAVVRQIDAEIGHQLLTANPGGQNALEAFTNICTLYLELTLNPEVQKIVFQDAPSVLGQRLRDIDSEGSIAPLAEALSDLMAQGVIVKQHPEVLFSD